MARQSLLSIVTCCLKGLGNASYVAVKETDKGRLLGV